MCDREAAEREEDEEEEERDTESKTKTPHKDAGKKGPPHQHGKP